MAGGEVIGAAIGVLLLILVGYVLVGSTLTTAEVVVSAQKDISIQNEARLQTSIDISGVTFVPLTTTTFTLTNTGSEPIKDFSHMDVILFSTVASPKRYSYDSTGATGWSYVPIAEKVNPGTLDSDEQILITVKNPGYTPSYVQVICANGAYTFSS